MDAPMLVFWGVSGSGKTTLAVNAACCLARQHCVGLISSNLQYGEFQAVFDRTSREGWSIFDALDDPVRTKDCFWPAGKPDNLFLLSAPNQGAGLRADTVSLEETEAVFDYAATYFDVLIVDGSPDISNPVSSVALARAQKICVTHIPTVQSCLWFQSMTDFIHQLRLGGKLTHALWEPHWGLPVQDYLHTLGIHPAVTLPDTPAARLGLICDGAKPSRRYIKQVQMLADQFREVLF